MKFAKKNLIKIALYLLIYKYYRLRDKRGVYCYLKYNMGFALKFYILRIKPEIFIAGSSLYWMGKMKNKRLVTFRLIG